MLMVGTSKEVVGQHLVVAGSVVIEIIYVGLYVSHGKGLAVTIECVDAVEPVAHGGISLSPRAGTQQKNDDDIGQQMFHGCKGIKSFRESFTLRQIVKLT